MKIITFASWKGGTGKTSLATACIETLVKQGFKILIIDLDSNMSISSIYNKIGCIFNSIEFLNGNISLGNMENNIKLNDKNGAIDIIPSDLKISKLNNISDRVLKTNIKKCEFGYGYDYIFIDPPGTMNALTRNAMIAADKIIIPSMFDAVDFNATKLILEEMEMCGVTADVQIVLNRFDEKRSTQGIEDKFRQDKQFKDFLWSGRIPAMRSISRLTSELSTYSLSGRARQIIENFVNEVIKS